MVVGFGVMTAYLFFFGPEKVFIKAEDFLSDEFEVEIDIPAPIIIMCFCVINITTVVFIISFEKFYLTTTQIINYQI